MRQKLSLLGILIGMVLLTAGLASGENVPPDSTVLVRVAVPGEAELALVEESGATVYARLTGEEGPYLLVGAPADQNWPAGLNVTLLDEGMDGATYVVAYLLPGQAHPDWHAFGELLLEDGSHALLRTSSGDAGRLGETGLQLRAVTMDPKPLRPAATGVTFPPVTEPDPLIQEMMDQVDSTKVYSYTAGLSGEWAVDIGGSPYTITTRHTYSGEPIHQATYYVGEHLAGLGLEIEYHQWGGATYPNVIAELTGLIDPDEVFVIGAHLDDKPDPPKLAPGADDNASGSVAVLMAADLLTQYEWGCTLRFALWTGEEQGLLGSKAYAQRAYNQGEQIAAYLNLDMIGWNTPGSKPDIALHADSGITPTLALAQLFEDVVDTYSLDLDPTMVPNGTGASDHAAFWDYGYIAILAIEDTEYGDFNPYYHTTNDLLQHLDMGYYTDMVKASVGTFAHMSDCLIRDGVGYLDGHVTDADDGSPVAGAVMTAGGAAGDLVTTETDSSGYYTRTLNTGTYSVTVQATHYLSQTVRDVAILPNQVTTEDVSLEPWPRVYLPLLMASG